MVRVRIRAIVKVRVGFRVKVKVNVRVRVGVRVRARVVVGVRVKVRILFTRDFCYSETQQVLQFQLDSSSSQPQR
jgi:hypothetical protein